MKTTYPSFSLRRLALAYENLPAFHAAYAMLVVIFAGIFNLGFFAILIAIHVALDFYKYRFALRRKHINALVAVSRENLADASLLLLGLSATVYLNNDLPLIASVQGWKLTHLNVMRGLAVLLPKLTILHHSLRILFNMSDYLHVPHRRLRMGWSLAECIYLFALLFSIVFLAFAANILHIETAEILGMLKSQLLPWLF